jgi:hypothetical protein
MFLKGPGPTLLKTGTSQALPTPCIELGEGV